MLDINRVESAEPFTAQNNAAAHFIVEEYLVKYKCVVLQCDRGMPRKLQIVRYSICT